MAGGFLVIFFGFLKISMNGLEIMYFFALISETGYYYISNMPSVFKMYCFRCTLRQY